MKKVHPEESQTSIQWEKAKDILLNRMDGTQVPLSSIYNDKKTVIIFMRRFDCPTCYTYAILFSHLRPVLQKSGMKIVFVSCYTDLNEVQVFLRSFAFWLRQVSSDGIQPLPGELFLDPTRESYRFFGIGNSLGKLDYIMLWWSLFLERKFGLFSTTKDFGKYNPKMSKHHAFLEIMNYIRLRMPVFIKHQGFQKDSIFWQSPGIVVVEKEKLLYRYVLKEQYKSVIPDPQDFVSSSLGLKTDEFSYFDFKDQMIKFIDIINNKAESAVLQKNELKVGEILGEGKDSHVFKSRWLGTDVAIKYYRTSEDKKRKSLTETYSAMNSFSNEVAIMMGLRHPNIIMFMGFGVDNESQFIVMEFMPRGSLFDVLGSTQELDMVMKRKFLNDIISGMRYIHERKPVILHLDLKSLNCLVDQDWTIKVSDFGIAQEQRRKYDQGFDDDELEETDKCFGTLQWLAPEAFGDVSGITKTKQVDVYSFGIVFWEILTRRRPWKGIKRKVIAESVMEGLRPEILDSDAWNPKVKSLVELCWHQDPKKRPCFKVISKTFEKIVVIP